MAKGSDLAVTRRLSSGASRSSRTRLRSGRACCPMSRAELPLPLAPPSGDRQSDAQKVHRCCCSGSAVDDVFAQLVVAVVVVVVAADGAFAVVRRVVGSDQRRPVQVVFRLASRAVVTGG
jgi:hypothetical protein